MTEEEHSAQEEMGEAVRFLIIKSGPTLAVERVSNGFIVLIRKIKKVRIPCQQDEPTEAWQAAQVPPMYDHAPYEEKYVCHTIDDMMTRVREHFEAVEETEESEDDS